MKLLEEMKQFFEESKSKPDYLDMDGDGNKKEPMKKAIKDKDLDEDAKPDYLDIDGNVKESRDPASIRKEYKELKKQSISNLRKEWSRMNKVGNPNSLDKEGLVSDIIRQRHGNKYVDKAFESKVTEANVTGNIDGGEGPPKTPYAFGKSEDEKDNAEVFDFKKSANSEKHFESIYKKMIATMEDLHEVSYRDYKKDPTSTPQQKVNRGIMEVNRMVGEMEKIVNNNLRLKTEMGVQSGHFWKATGRRFAKINERMLRVAHRLKELSQ